MKFDKPNQFFLPDTSLMVTYKSESTINSLRRPQNVKHNTFNDF